MLLLVTAVVVVGVVMAAAISVSGMRAQQARLAAYDRMHRERAGDASRRAAQRAREVRAQVEDDRAYLRSAHERAEFAVRPFALSLAARVRAVNDEQADAEARVRAYVERVNDMLGTRTATLRGNVAGVVQMHDMDLENRLDPYQTLTELRAAVGFSNHTYNLADFELRGASLYPSSVRSLTSVADEYLERQGELRAQEAAIRASIQSAALSVSANRSALYAGASQRAAQVATLAATGFDGDLRDLAAAAQSEVRSVISAAAAGTSVAAASLLSVSGDVALYRIAAGGDNAETLRSMYATQASNYLAQTVAPYYGAVSGRYGALLSELSAGASINDRAVSAAFQAGLSRLVSVSSVVEAARDALSDQRTQLATGAAGASGLYVARGSLAPALSAAVASGQDLRGLAGVVVDGLAGATVKYADVRTTSGMDSLNAYAASMDGVAQRYEGVRPRWRDFFAPGASSATSAQVLVSELQVGSGVVGQVYRGNEYRMTFPENTRFAGLRVGGAASVPFGAFGTSWGEFETEAGLSAQVATRVAVAHTHPEFVTVGALPAEQAAVSAAMAAAVQQARPALAQTLTEVPIAKVSTTGCAAGSVRVTVDGLQDALRGATLVGPPSVASGQFDWAGAPPQLKLFDMSAMSVPTSSILPERVSSVSGLQFPPGAPRVPIAKVSLPATSTVPTVSECSAYSNVSANVLRPGGPVCTISATTSNSCAPVIARFNDRYGNEVALTYIPASNVVALGNPALGIPVYDVRLTNGELIQRDRGELFPGDNMS